MDLNLLVALDHLLREGSVTEAARRMGLSASAVSRALGRLRATTADPLLAELLTELLSYPVPAVPTTKGRSQEEAEPPIVVPLQLRLGETVLSLISTTTVFGTPVDVTLSELALETFFPADEATGRALRAIAEASASA